MATLTNEERETHLNLAASDRTQWEVFSDDPVMLRKLDGIGAECIGVVGEGKRYRLEAGQVIVRRMPSAEVRAKKALNLRKGIKLPE